MSSLAKRVLTAVVFIPIVLGCLYWGGIAFFLLVLAISLVAMFELGTMLEEIGGPVSKPLLYIFSGCLLLAIYWQKEQIIPALVF